MLLSASDSYELWKGVAHEGAGAAEEDAGVVGEKVRENVFFGVVFLCLFLFEERGA